ncbi:hypothetical protein RO3G_11223 [Rhizopus delemar RA 99-880]|uniref:Uncharacterized protein n=1 Tax=Rhizopus delemar (strain RA 99-880 / ATCC MYA-4621 / FGSC 9543 / NRRL 43880) TaxID=246409 RepID=I1CDI2_RHIO9|nr:hypothetical protein RO3G_11223 [Rhizopus delemar RA 99-880]|eukprot:EIE86512.1 hypothetical protein RO3G_11223 [Rhizopus delemar RA 99-880]
MPLSVLDLVTIVSEEDKERGWGWVRRSSHSNSRMIRYSISKRLIDRGEFSRESFDRPGQ